MVRHAVLALAILLTGLVASQAPQAKGPVRGLFDHVIMGIPIDGRPKGPYNPAMPILEALMTLSYLAAVTSRVTLGTEVLVLPQRESRTRRHFDVVAESLRSDIRAVAEGMAASREQTDWQLGEQTGRTDGLEGRVLRLEVDVSGLKARRKPRRPRRR